MEIEERKIFTKGRPRTGYFLDGKEISKEEAVLMRLRLPQELEEMPKVMTPEQLTVFARSGVPALLRRATELAMNSDDIRAVLLVAKELGDRGFGKAVQGITVHIGDDINAAWKEIGVIDADDI